MKPFKAATGVAMWMLRISLALYIVVYHIPNLTPIDLTSFTFYLTFLLVVSAFFLILGGVSAKPSATIISGLAIFILTIISIVREFSGDINVGISIQLMAASIAFMFLCLGNNK